MDNWSSRKVILIVLVLLAVFAGTFYFATSIKSITVSNPSFEYGVSGGPTDWFVVSSGPENVGTWDDKNAYDGQRSIRIDYSGTGWISLVHSGINAKPPLMLEPLTNYEVSFYVKSSNLDKLCIEYDTHSTIDDSLIRAYSCPNGVISFQADGKWHKVTTRFSTESVPKDTYILFVIDFSSPNEGNSGTIWIDGPVTLNKK